MYRIFVGLFAIAAALLTSLPAGAVKRASYPEVKVTALPAFKGDAALEALRKKLVESVSKQDLASVIALVDPKFVWTAGGKPVEEFDPKKDGVHNFKVAFGFRAFGRNEDGKTDIGPQWFLLELFLADPSLTQEANSPLVCGPATARIADPKAFEKVLERVDEESEPSEWVFASSEVPLMDKPGGSSRVGALNGTAMPVLGFHPPLPANTPPKEPPTHFELLLPSGKTAWAETKNLRALFVDRLCYSKDAKGDWKIGAFDQAE